MSLPYHHLSNYQQYQQHPNQQTDQGQPSVPLRSSYLANQPFLPQPFQQQIPSIIPNPNSIPDALYTPTIEDLNQTFYQHPHQQQPQPQQQQQRGNFPLLSDAAPILYPPNIQIPIEQHIQQSYQSFNSRMSQVPNAYIPSINTQQFVNQYPHPYVVGQPVYQRHPSFNNKPTRQFNNSDIPMSYHQYQQRKPVFHPQTSASNESTLPNVFAGDTIAVEVTTSTSHFKPIRTKKNSRPRINKLNKNEQISRRSSFGKKKGSMVIGELSVDELFQHFQDVLKIEKPNDNMIKASFQLKMKNELEYQLFDLFIHSLSKSIDIFLPQEIFRKVIPELALYDETNMIIDSIFCLSSLMLQRIRPDKVDSSIPIKYYHQSIKSIRYYLSIPGIENNEKGIISRCLLSTILLCIYELFFVAIDSTYVKGASSILSSILMKNNQSRSLLKNSPFHQTCFWAMFICDLILSLKYNLPSMYSIEKFWKPLDPGYFDHYDNQLLYSKESETFLFSKEYTLWWMHKSAINFSLINEFKNQVDVITKKDFESNKPYYEWLELKRKLDEFETTMPINLKPTIYKPSSINRVFPIIFFKDEATAIMCLNFKLSKIALYESLMSKTDTKNPLVLEELAKYPENYPKKLAKDILGIMKTYDANLFIWPVNVHAIRQVAHYVFDEPEAFHGLEELVERIVVICHLKLKVKGII